MNDSELQARGASNKETAETASIRCTMTLCEENKGAQITAAEDILSTHSDFRPDLHLVAAAIHTLASVELQWKCVLSSSSLFSHFNLTNSWKWNTKPTLSFVF